MYDDHAEWDYANVDKKYLNEEWFDQRYIQAIATFVSDYHQHDISENTMDIIEMFLQDMSKTHDTSGYFNKRFFDDVFRGMNNKLLKEKFVQEMFFLQFKGKPMDHESRLTVLYKHYTKYIAEAAAQLGTYDFVMEYVAEVFEEAKLNANSTSLKKVISPSYQSDDPNKDYEAVSEAYKLNDPNIVAVELSYYVELLDWTEARKMSKRKQMKFLNGFDGHLYEARALIQILEGP